MELTTDDLGLLDEYESLDPEHPRRRVLALCIRNLVLERTLETAVHPAIRDIILADLFANELELVHAEAEIRRVRGAEQ